jgi:multimeric flavodoxin WrbA
MGGSSLGDEEANIVKEKVRAELSGRGWTVEVMPLASMDMAPCRGCFGCWTRSPGECVIDDQGRSVAQGLARADLWVLLTPVTFGGYSSALKR